MFDGGRQSAGASRSGAAPSLPSWIAPKRVKAEPPRDAQDAGLSSADAPPSARGSREGTDLTRRLSVPAPVHIVDSQPPAAGPGNEGDLARADEAIARLEAEVETLRAALGNAVVEAANARREALAASEGDLVLLATAIAEQVVGRELRTEPERLLSWAKAGIEALADRDDVCVVISPDIAELVDEREWTAALGQKVMVDMSFARGSCVIRARYGRVDAGLTARVATVVEALEGTAR